LNASLDDLIRQTRLIAFDFDGVFTDNMVYVFEDGREAVRCSRADGLGLSKLKRLGIHSVIISTETNPVVSARARKLSIRCVQGVEDKRTALESVLRKHNLTFEQAAFVGNDINDLPCLTAVALPIVVQDAHPDVLLYARYQTKTRGGYGAVREVCDLFTQVFGDLTGL
jgi:YrbI family 3-deoxy-D-manno-octulosonate 8-phosphate phosphatase